MLALVAVIHRRYAVAGVSRRRRKVARGEIRGATDAMTDGGSEDSDPRAPAVVEVCPCKSEVLVHASRLVL